MKFYRSILWILTLVVTSLLSPNTCVMAEGNGGGGFRGGGGATATSSSASREEIVAALNRPRPTRRSCHATDVTQSNNAVSFECQSSNATEIYDQIDYLVHTQDASGICISVAYKQNASDTTDASMNNATIDVCIDSLIEYRKTNIATVNATEQAYNWGHDQVIQVVNLANWTSFSDVSTDYNNVMSFLATTTDDLVTLTFAMSPSKERDRVTPNNIKMDVRIVNFPWQFNDTYIALLSRVQSKHAFSRTDRSNYAKAKHPKNVTLSYADVTKTIRYDMQGEFTWADTALVNLNTTIPVVATRLLQEQDNASSLPIAFSFVGDSGHLASDILWDPEVGVGYASRSSGDELVWEIFLIAPIVIVAIICALASYSVSPHDRISPHGPCR